MNLVVVGISHHNTPVELREKLNFPFETLGEILPKFLTETHLDELVILSTCNRTEIYAVGSEILTENIIRIKQMLALYRKIPLEDFNDHLYIHHGSGAVRHLFRVSSSLDSMIIGESQITGQVKEAYDLARNVGCTGILLNGLFQQSFNVAKTIRTSTEVAKGAISVSSVAVDLAEKIFGDLRHKRVLIIGAGETGELTLKYLVQQGVRSITVANRHYERAVQLATTFHGEAIKFEDIYHYLKDVDIVLSSTSAPDVIIKKEHLLHVMPHRKYSPIFLIDIAVPRDIESQVNTVDNVFLYNIDDLEQIVKNNLQGRTKELEKCEEIVEEEQKKFLNWYSTLSITPVIRKLNDRIEQIEQQELQRVLNQIPDLTEEQKEKIKAMAQRMVGQFLHTPIENLKRHVSSGNGYSYAEVLSDLFELNKNGNDNKKNEIK